jgi:Gpi18-like mannosyltransferase
MTKTKINLFLTGLYLRFLGLRDWQKVLIGAFLFLVIILGIGTYANATLFDFNIDPTSGEAGRSSLSIVSSFFRYDTAEYKNIIQNGYSVVTVAFFPLFPFTAKILMKVTSFDVTWAILVTSWIFFFLAAVVVFYWIRFELKERQSQISPWAVVGLIALFPTAFYFISGYSESLFVFLTVSSLFAYRKQHYVLAAVLGALSAATRVQGAAVAVFFLCDYLFTKDWSKWKKLIPVIITPLGVCAYMLYLHYSFGNPFEFIIAQQQYWGRLHGNVITNLISSFRPVYVWFLPVLFIGLWATYKFLGKSWFFYSLIFILIPLASGRLDSLSRYMLTLVPLFLGLALWLESKPKLVTTLYIISSAFLLAWSILLFTNNYWVA